MENPQSQTAPLAPAGVKSDEQPYTSTAVFTVPKHRQKSSKFLVYVLAAIVFHGVIFLIFGSVFLRVVNPKLRLSNVSIQNFKYENTNSTSLNITMLTDVTVVNKNFGRYVFENCNAVVLYGNSTIGGGHIPGGRVGKRKSKSTRVMMEVGSANLNFSSNIGDSREVMEITSYAKMTGRVHVMKIVNRRKTIEMNCTINLNLTSGSIMDSLCR